MHSFQTQDIKSCIIKYISDGCDILHKRQGKTFFFFCIKHFFKYGYAYGKLTIASLKHKANIVPDTWCIFGPFQK